MFLIKRLFYRYERVFIVKGKDHAVFLGDFLLLLLDFVGF